MGEGICEGLIKRAVNDNKTGLDNYNESFKNLDFDFHEDNSLKERKEKVEAVRKLRKIIIEGQKETAKSQLPKKKQQLDKTLTQCEKVISELKIYQDAADESLEK